MFVGECLANPEGFCVYETHCLFWCMFISKQHQREQKMFLVWAAEVMGRFNVFRDLGRCHD